MLPVILGRPEHLVLRADPRVMLRVVTEPRGAEALRPALDMLGRPVQDGGEDEQHDGVATDQRDLRIHAHYSSPAPVATGSRISVNRMSSGSSSVTRLTR